MEAVVAPRRKAATKRHPSPFVTVLNHAADRLYLDAIWLGDRLRDDPSGTLFAPSATPEAFGRVRPSLDAGKRQKALQNC